MGLFSNSERFKLVKKTTEPLYRVPESIQESIPISRINENGIFEIEDLEGEHMFDKLYMFDDINFCDLDETEKRDKFRQICDILNSLDSNFKIQIFNFNEDMDKFRKDVLLKARFGASEFEESLVSEYNKVIEDKMINGINGISQVKFLCLTCKREDFESAKSYFNSIESTLKSKYKSLGSELYPLDTESRLKYLFYLYQMGHESEFDLRFEALRLRHVWKDDVAGDFINVKKSYLEFEDRYVCVMHLSRYASSITDSFLSELTNISYRMGVTIDVTPVPKDIALKKLEQVYSNVEQSIQNQQKVRNKQGAFSSDISYRKRMEKKEIEKYLDDMNKNDANLFWVNILMFVVGDTKEELEANIRSIDSITKGFKFRKCIKRQLEAFNSSLPVGGRYVDYMQPLFTQPLAGFIPFYTKKIRQSNGLFYGNNQNDKSLITINRKALTNGNGFIFGVPGAGKSFFAKQEMGQVISTTQDHGIVIDPQGEYKDIAAKWSGKYINFGARAENYINPFDYNEESELDFNSFVLEKSSFSVTLIKSVMETDLNTFHKSVIEMAVREMYEKAKKYNIVPKFEDLQKELESFENEYQRYAKELAIAIDPFVKGSLSIFNHSTNINIDDNRFTIFGLNDINEELWKPAMLIMMDFIDSKVATNFKKGIATWLWMDEIHVLLDDEMTASRVEAFYKTFRKFRGIATGMTQNIVDIMTSKVTQTIVSNCEFIVLLRQANLDRSLISNIIEITNSQLQYVTNSVLGTGLLRVGKDVIPFDGRIETKNKGLYDLFNTNPYESIEKEKNNE